MKIENLELTSITKTDVETTEEEKDKTTYTAKFENKDKGLKCSITQEEEFELDLGQKYDIKIETGQKKLTDVKK